MNELSQNDDVTVHLEMPDRIAIGRVPLAVLRLTLSPNARNERQISGRLNLWEGDVCLTVTGPNGIPVKVVGAGSLPDTTSFVIALKPGQQFAAVLNLLYTSVGYPFAAPGAYSVSAEYFPSPKLPPIVSESVRIEAYPADTDEARGIAALLLSPSAPEVTETGRALSLAQPNETPTAREGLVQLSRRFAQTPEGVMAALLLAALPVRRPWAAVSKTAKTEPKESADAQTPLQTVEAILSEAVNAPARPPDLITLAGWITALETPFSNARGDLGEKFASWVEKSATDTAPAADNSAAANITAVQIARFRPFSY